MIRQYKALCREYKCKTRIYSKMTGSLKNIGLPDLLILFTSTVSHKTICNTLERIKEKLERDINAWKNRKSTAMWIKQKRYL